MPAHRGQPRVSPFVLAAVVVAGGVLFAGGLSLAALTAATPPPQAPPAVTVTIPAPTVTISYLIERTVTPGLNGY